MEQGSADKNKKNIFKGIILVAILLLGCGLAILLFGMVRVEIPFEDEIPEKEEMITQGASMSDQQMPESDLREEPLERTVEDMIQYMAPALVHVYRVDDAGNYTAGSGYIVEITEDKIYICTNRHAVTTTATCDIYFYEGTKVEGKIIGAAEHYDVGVVTVEKNVLPEALRQELKAVTIDYTYWEVLDEEPILLGLGRVSREGGFDHITTGNLIKIKQYFEWDSAHPHTEVTVALEAGDSGSAILDDDGNLIAMAYAYSTEPTRYWCVPLDEILKAYREITGRNPRVF